MGAVSCQKEERWQFFPSEEMTWTQGGPCGQQWGRLPTGHPPQRQSERPLAFTHVQTRSITECKTMKMLSMAPRLTFLRTLWTPLCVRVYSWLRVSFLFLTFSFLCFLTNYVYLVILRVVCEPPLCPFWGKQDRTVNP